MCFCLCSLFYRGYVLAGYFLSVLLCLLSMLISDSRFDLVWFRLSCDHGWIRSGSVNVRKQQQQQPNASTRSHDDLRSLPCLFKNRGRLFAEITRHNNKIPHTVFWLLLRLFLHLNDYPSSFLSRIPTHFDKRISSGSNPQIHVWRVC